MRVDQRRELRKLVETFEILKDNLGGQSIDVYRAQDILTKAFVVLLWAEFEAMVRGELLKKIDKEVEGEMKLFIKSKLKEYVPNVSCDELIKLLKNMSGQKASRLKQKLRDRQKYKSHYQSLYENRKNIVHPRNNATLTFSDALDYYRKARVVLAWFLVLLRQK